MGSRAIVGDSIGRLFKKPLSPMPIVLLALILSYSPQAYADAKEYDVKAVYVFNFLKFTRWPEEMSKTSNSSYNICVAGRNPFGNSLKKIANQIELSRPVQLYIGVSKREINNCHILFISRSLKTRYKETLRTINNKGILTVSDIKGFAKASGIIEMVIRRGRIHLMINTTAAEKSGIFLNSMLLEVATVVNNGDH